MAEKLQANRAGSPKKRWSVSVTWNEKENLEKVLAFLRKHDNKNCIYKLNMIPVDLLDLNEDGITFSNQWE